MASTEGVAELFHDNEMDDFLATIDIPVLETTSSVPLPENEGTSVLRQSTSVMHKIIHFSLIIHFIMKKITPSGIYILILCLFHVELPFHPLCRT